MFQLEFCGYLADIYWYFQGRFNLPWTVHLFWYNAFLKKKKKDAATLDETWSMLQADEK